MLRQKFAALILRSLFTFAALGIAAGCDGPEQREADYISRGVERLEAGDLIKARVELRNALQINPKGAEALYYLAVIDQANGDLRKAYEKFSEVILRDPSHIGALLKIAQIHFVAGQSTAALDKANAVLAIEPRNADAHAIQAAIALRQGEISEAEELGKTALRHDPTNVQAAAALAGIYRQSDRADQALEVLARALKKKPTDKALRLIKMKIHADRGELTEVEQTYKKLIEISPEDLSIRRSLAQFYADSGRVAEGERVLLDAAQEFPDDPQPKMLVVNYLANTKGYADAEIKLQEFITDYPGQTELKFFLAESYVKRSKFGEAQKIYHDIVDTSGLSPTGTRARALLAYLYFRNGELAAANRLIGEVLDEDPQNSSMLILRSRLALAEDDYQGAIADLRTVLRSEPDSKEAIGLLASAHLEGGEIELAIRNYESLLRVDPNNYAARAQLSKLLAKHENVGAALEILDLESKVEYFLARQSWAKAESIAREALENEDTQPLGHRLLGDIFRATGQLESAIVQYQNALEREPRSVRAANSLVAVYVSADRIQDGLRFFEDRIVAEDRDAIAYNALGQLYVGQKADREVIEEAFRQAVNNDRSWPVPYLNLARLYVSGGQHRRAAAIIKQALKYNAGHTGLKFALAEIYQLAQQYNSAIDAYESILRDGVQGVPVLNNLAALIADFEYEDKQRLELALSLVRPFEGSADSTLLDTLGWLYYRLGNYSQAVHYLEKAVQSGEDSPQRRYHLGMAYLRKGKVELARAQLEKAVAEPVDYPGAPLARETLRDITILRQ